MSCFLFKLKREDYQEYSQYGCQYSNFIYKTSDGRLEIMLGFGAIRVRNGTGILYYFNIDLTLPDLGEDIFFWVVKLNKIKTLHLLTLWKPNTFLYISSLIKIFLWNFWSDGITSDSWREIDHFFTPRLDFSRTFGEMVRYLKKWTGRRNLFNEGNSKLAYQM